MADRAIGGMGVMIVAGVLAGGSNAAVAAEGGAVVRYADFGAKGDGVADDLGAIVAAHAYANSNGLPVRAENGATYLIGAGPWAEIRTDTDFGSATFRIDDTQLSGADRWRAVFRIGSAQPMFRPEGVGKLKRSQTNLGVRLPSRSLVVLADANVKHFIRRGLNKDNGYSKTDIVLVDADGTIDPGTPLLWDFDAVTDIRAYPVDETTLTVRGGRFITVANQAESKYTYYGRGIQVERSNVVIDGLEHTIVGEGEQGAPYRGFITVSRCAHVTIRDTALSGHKTYTTVGSAGSPVQMGSYDFSVDRATYVSLVSCRQVNDINDGRLWGVMGSNYSKNITFDKCTLSRFDAHKGVYNATIRGSTVRLVNLIGGGAFLMEDTTVTGSTLVNLRSDYGSFWSGDLTIRNSVIDPAGDKPLRRLTLIIGQNDGQHNFGYECSMPRRITIENLRIGDMPVEKSYAGPVLFGDFKVNEEGGEFPYGIARDVVVKGVVVDSGKPLKISDQPEVFAAASITQE